MVNPRQEKFGPIVEQMKIIFITGASRSGSTILAQVLGEMKEVTALGEVSYVWERGFDENRLCGCGKTFQECDFWAKVVREAFPNERDLDLDRLLRTTSSVERFRYLPFHLFLFSFPRFSEKVKYLSEKYFQIYRSAALINSSSVLIDSSKHIHGHVLVKIPEIDLYVIHLVRDGRATNYSWSRKKVLEERPGQTVYFPRFSPMVAAMHWLLDNMSAELLRFRARKYLRIRYEDFAENPRETVDEILNFAHLRNEENPISHDGRTQLGVQHHVSGNPSRFRVGETLIRVDNQWEKDMPKRTKFLISFLVSPLLWRYGYFSKMGNGRDKAVLGGSHLTRGSREDS